MAEVFLHLWAPAEGYWADGIRAWLGEPVGIETATRGEESVEVVRWTFLDDVARERRLVVDLFSTGEAPLANRGDLSDDRDRFWPRISFSTSADTEVPLDLLTLDHTEVVGGTDDLWFHFVDESDDPPYNCTYRQAVEDGVWGIEEGFLEGGEAYPAGWWVTSGKAAGPRPGRLHSVF